MPYTVKGVYRTVQGEGARSGRAAVLCRFSGCNLWSGLEVDRSRAKCRFCDTDFVGGDKFDDAEALAAACLGAWRGEGETVGEGEATTERYVVLTGGEPLLQVDEPLLAELHRLGFEVAVETNGTIAPPSGIDWLTVSPKLGTELVATVGDELKLVWPQPGFDLRRLATLRFSHFFLQPMDGNRIALNTELVLRLTADSAIWRPSLQLHKFLALP